MFPNANRDKELKERVEKIETNASNYRINRTKDANGERTDKNWFFKNVVIPKTPVIIASSDCIGTARARCNHMDALLHYYTEEEALKAAGAPIFPIEY